MHQNFHDKIALYHIEVDQKKWRTPDIHFKGRTKSAIIIGVNTPMIPTIVASIKAPCYVF